jgi:hypothetical protein
VKVGRNKELKKERESRAEEKKRKKSQSCKGMVECGGEQGGCGEEKKTKEK